MLILRLFALFCNPAKIHIYFLYMVTLTNISQTDIIRKYPDEYHRNGGVSPMECSCKQQHSDLSKLEPVLAQYAAVKGSLITILQQAQEIYGYLPMDVIYHVAERTGSTPAKVLGVATFYTQFRFQPMGKYLILLCDGTACHVNGSERIAAAISEYLGIQNGETSADGLFSLSIVACLGCCSLSPVMMINEDTYGSLTPEKALAILKEIREKEDTNA